MIVCIYINIVFLRKYTTKLINNSVRVFTSLLILVYMKQVN